MIVLRTSQFSSKLERTEGRYYGVRILSRPPFAYVLLSFDDLPAVPFMGRQLGTLDPWRKISLTVGQGWIETEEMEGISSFNNKEFVALVAESPEEYALMQDGSDDPGGMKIAFLDTDNNAAGLVKGDIYKAALRAMVAQDPNDAFVPLEVDASGRLAVATAPGCDLLLDAVAVPVAGYDGTPIDVRKYVDLVVQFMNNDNVSRTLVISSLTKATDPGSLPAYANTAGAGAQFVARNSRFQGTAWAGAANTTPLPPFVKVAVPAAGGAGSAGVLNVWAHY